jgi:hypothetical protein
MPSEKPSFLKAAQEIGEQQHVSLLVKMMSLLEEQLVILLPDVRHIRTRPPMGGSRRRRGTPCNQTRILFLYLKIINTNILEY